MYSGCELKTGVGSGNFNNKWEWNFQYSWIWDTGKIGGYGNFNQRWLLSHWVCVCVACLCYMSSHECQRKQRLSNLPIIILCFTFPILAQVLFFLFQSTASSDKAEVRVQTSPISKPANILGGFSTICIICVFNYMVILCIYSVVFFTEKRYWITEIRCHIVWKKVLHSCCVDWLDNFYFFVDGPTSINRKWQYFGRLRLCMTSISLNIQAWNLWKIRMGLEFGWTMGGIAG